jgi:glucans biosynthesis protein C
MNSNLSSKRFAARGPLALLGIVLHLCTFYNPVNPFPVSREHHWITVAVSDFIHSFRMEAFMLIAGVAFTIQIKKYNELRFLWNRTKRLLLPFLLIAVFLNYPIYLLFAGRESWQTTSLLNAPAQATIMHLWFLRDLFLISVFAVSLYFSKTLTRHSNQESVKRFIYSHQVLLLCALPILLVVPRALGFLFPIVATESASFGSIENLLRYALFFFIGTLVVHMSTIKNLIERPSQSGVFVALIAFSITWTFSVQEFASIAGKTFGFAAKQVCTFILTALAFQCCYRFSFVVNRIFPSLDKASYSIYLLHLPILILVANATGKASLPIWLDWPLIFAVTTFLCLYFFHLSEQLKQVVFFQRSTLGLRGTIPARD